MNISNAINQAIKSLRQHGQPVTQDHVFLVHVADGLLTVAAFKPSCKKEKPDEAIAVRARFNSKVVICGCFYGSMHRFFQKFSDIPHEWVQIEDAVILTGESFKYRLELKSWDFSIQKTHDFILQGNQGREKKTQERKTA